MLREGILGFKNSKQLLLHSKYIIARSSHSGPGSFNHIGTEKDQQAQILHHDNLAHKWWDSKSGPVHALHSMNAIRVPFIRDGLIATNKVKRDFLNTSKILKGLNILEVGCGGGILTECLGKLHANVTGIDLGEELITVAQNHLRESNNPSLAERITYKVESIEDHSKAHQSAYDAVVISEVLEHIIEKPTFIENSVNTLKPGGSIFITTLSKTILNQIFSIWFAENVLQLVPKGTHQYENLISSEDVEEILKKNNCVTVLVNGFAYEFWNNTWKWIPSTLFSYALQAVKKI